jgi:hypothetical protein
MEEFNELTPSGSQPISCDLDDTSCSRAVYEEVESVLRVNTEPIRKKSLLPSWIISMRSNLEKSCLVQQEAESRLNKIYNDCTILTSKLQQLQPSTVGKSSDNDYGISDSAKDNHSKDMMTVKSKKLFSFNLEHLPNELIIEIFEYLFITEIFLISLTSRRNYTFLKNCSYWSQIGFYYYCHLFSEEILSSSSSLSSPSHGGRSSLFYDSILLSLEHVIEKPDFWKKKKETFLKQQQQASTVSGSNKGQDNNVDIYEKYASVSKKIAKSKKRKCIFSVGSQFYSSARRDLPPDEIFLRIQLYYQSFCRCLQFVTQLKDQRSIPKHRQVAPHRYSRGERQISPPLHLFDSNGDGETLLGRRSSSSSSSFASERIMSQTETLNSDFRSFAHQTLQLLVDLTGKFYDSFCNHLINEGIITILVSLLSNEEGSLQNYSCNIVGNLFCWESLVKKKIELCISRKEQKSNERETEIDNDDMDDDISRLKTYKVPLIDQITTCNGHRQLASLLTSPSASVNLAVGKASLYSHEPTHLSHHHQFQSTSNIEGVCNKHASRALICIFYPDFPVFTKVQTNKTGSKAFIKRDEKVQTAMKKDSVQLKVSAEAVQSSNLRLFPLKPVDQQNECQLESVWKFSSPLPPILSSPTKKKSSHGPHLHTSPNSFHRNQFSSSDKKDADHSSPSSSSSSFVFPFLPIQLILISDDKARPWQFTYFYKSGVFKDQFIVSLRFVSIHCIRGKGYDNIRYFVLDGRLEMDIIGQKFLFSKTYCSPDEDDSEDPEVEEPQRKGSFLRDSSKKCSDFSSSSTGAHVKHLAYWSDEITTSRYETDRSERWSQGIWGVWETAVNSSHYELMKGGIFRAVPVEEIVDTL